MHVLYVDDSGSARNVSEEFLVLGSLSVFEAQANFFIQELDKLAISLNPNDRYSVEFHASEILSGRQPLWNKLSRHERRGVIKQVLRIVAAAYDSVRVFACAVHMASIPDRDPMEIAFEDICNRFDFFLKRLQASGDRQKGLIMLDKSSYETSLQAIIWDFRILSTRWGWYATAPIHRCSWIHGFPG